MSRSGHSFQKNDSLSTKKNYNTIPIIDGPWILEELDPAPRIRPARLSSK